MHSIILKLIYINQYGFIQNMIIQDFLGWAFEYLISAITPGKKLVLKLDFEKAFDLFEHITFEYS